MVKIVSFARLTYNPSIPMKNLLILILALFLAASCNKPEKNSYLIKGTADTSLSGYVYLQKRDEGPLQKIDSVLLDKGTFQFTGIIVHPEVYYINVPATRTLVPFFVEPSVISIDLNTRNVDQTRITGSDAQTVYDHYLDELDLFNNRMKENYNLYQKAMEIGDKIRTATFDSLLNDEEIKRSAFIKEYVLSNPASIITPYVVYQNSYDYDLEKLEEAVNSFDPSLADSKYTGFLNKYLDLLRKTAVGQPYTGFTMADTSGTEVSLSGVVGGKYLLIDFWASWCGPCREENPNLVAVYKDFSNKGFDIFGVSLDNRRDRWIKAIADDGLIWHHVSDLKGWENSASRLYGIRSIPANVLLDTNGIIIARNLRGTDLREKMESLFPAGS
jgi:thiol-disulfide isomerase/thioredoxin